MNSLFHMQSDDRRDRVPSVLDSPRFFDEEALSAWKFKGHAKDLAASKDTMKKVGLQVYSSKVRAGSGEVGKLVDTEEGNPIMVEIVRGVDGPQDETWSVIVDGIVQTKGFGLHESNDDEQALVCTLPPGIAVDKAITKSTMVRPVVIAIRLESEALKPMSMTGSFTQILETTEHRERDEYEEKKMDVTFVLKDYRTDDIVSNVAVVQYPFRAPAQSALGILSIGAVQRQVEKNTSIIAYNTWARTVNGVKQSVYDARQKSYLEFMALDKSDDFVNKGFGLINKINNAIVIREEDKTQLFIEKLRMRMKEPKKPRYVSEQFTRDSEQLKDNIASGSFVIGGRTKSAVQELTSLFLILEMACREVQNEPNANKMSLVQQMEAMRFALQTFYNNEAALALFDALHTTDPVPTTSFLLDVNKRLKNDAWSKLEQGDVLQTIRANYVVKKCQKDTFGRISASPPDPDDDDDDDNYEVGQVEDLPADVKEKFNEMNKDYFKSEEEYVKKQKNVPYAFMYERLSDEVRRRTNLTSRIDIEVRDFDVGKLPFKLRLQASEEDAYEAHAVYSNVALQIEDLDKAATSFVDCMFRTHIETRDNAPNIVWNILGRLNSYFNAAFMKRVYYKNQGIKVTGIFQAMRFAGASAAQGIFGKGKTLEKFSLDPCRFEERVAELRIMARQTLPVPRSNKIGLSPGDASKLSEAIMDKVAAAAAPDPAAAAAAAAPDPAPAPVATPPALLDLESSSGMDGDYAVKGNDTRLEDRTADISVGPLFKNYYKREFEDEEAEMIAKLKAELESTEPDDQSNADSSQISAAVENTIVNELVVRRLPQILSASRVISPRFMPYTFVDPLMVPASKDGWNWQNPASIAATAVAGVAGFLGYIFVNEFAADQLETMKKVGDAAAIASSIASTLASLAIGTQLGTPWGLIGALVTLLTKKEVVKILKNTFNTSIPTWFPSADRLLYLPTYKNAAVFAFGLGQCAYSFTRFRLVQMEAQKAVFLQHRRALTGQPINACLASARYAISNAYQEKKKNENSTLFGSSGSQSAVYNHKTGNRVNFYQYYWSESNRIREEALQRDDVIFVHDDDDWVRAPDASAMNLLPPPEITYKMYEGRVLRGMRFEQTISFVTGSGASQTTTELAATAAILEVRQVVHRSRLELKGEHLMKSEYDMVVSLLADAASILSHVYAAENTSFVKGNDILWSCLKGGVVARLALRHLPMFQQIQEKWSGRSMSYFEFLKPPRLGMVREFATDLSRIAKSVPRASSYMPLQTDLLVNAVAKSFFNVSSLMKGNAGSERIKLALAVVASTAAHELMLTKSNKDISQTLSSFRYTLVSLLDSYSKNPAQVARAQNPQNPQTATSTELLGAAWAHRRVDTTSCREWKYGRLQGRQALVTKLSGITSTDSHLPRIYYCGMGSNLLDVPSFREIHPDALASRIVDLNELTVCLNLLSSNITDPLLIQQPTMVSISAISNENEVGFARHPLALRLDGNSVSVHLVSNENYDSGEVGIDDKVHDFRDLSIEMHVIDSLINGSIDSDALRKLVTSSRKIAFNSERLVFALELAMYTFPNASKKLVIKLEEPIQAVSLAIAMSILHSKYDTQWGNDATVFVPNKQDSVAIMNTLRRKLQYPTGTMGLSTCLLSELVLCV